MDLLKYGADAQVIAPAALRDAMKSLIEEMGSNYR